MTRWKILENAKHSKIVDFHESKPKVLKAFSNSQKSLIFEDFPGNIAEDIINNLQLLPVVLDKIYSGSNKVKFDSATILLVISRKSPEILYPHIDFFIGLRDNKNKLNMWNTIEIIANLSAVDSQDRINDIFDRFYDIIFNDSMASAVHVIDNSWKIVKFKPELQEKVIDKFLNLKKFLKIKDARISF